jgi:hypothetical protein
MKNYELIYKIRAGGYNTNSAQNLRIQYANKAREEADKVHTKYLEALTLLLGHDRFEVTNVACMADGIIGHVYTWDEGINPRPSSGHKKCVFCGCDDFDF